MSKNFRDLTKSPEMRRAYQLDYSIRMISDITTHYDEVVDSGLLLCARTMLDVFFVHVRLLADFLVRPTKAGVDFGPADFDIEWTAPQTPEAAALRDNWRTASKYVVHFGLRRVPEDLEDLDAFEIGGQAFKAIAANGLTVFAEFIRRLETQTPAWSEEPRVPNKGTDPLLWQAKMLADRTTLLRDSFDEACGKLGLDGETLRNP